MAGEVLNMSNLTINKFRCKLKDLCFKNRHKTIYLTLGVSLRLDSYHKEKRLNS